MKKKHTTQRNHLIFWLKAKELKLISKLKIVWKYTKIFFVEIWRFFDFYAHITKPKRKQVYERLKYLYERINDFLGGNSGEMHNYYSVKFKQRINEAEQLDKANHAIKNKLYKQIK